MYVTGSRQGGRSGGSGDVSFSIGIFGPISNSRIISRWCVGARGFPLRLISSLGVRGGGLARFQNCSTGGVGGGVQPKYLENCQKVPRQNPRQWALENRLGAVQHASLHGISPRFFLVSQFIRKINTQPQIYEKLKNLHLILHTKTTHNSKKNPQGCGSYLTKYGLTISHGDPDQAPKTSCVEPIPLRGLIGPVSYTHLTLPTIA